MKVYLHYEKEPVFTHPFVIDTDDLTLENILQNFVSEYNRKHTTTHLDTAALALSRERSGPNPKTLSLSSTASQTLTDKEDIFVIPSPKTSTYKCTHNGCGQTYTEGDGSQCYYHSGPAVFHEGQKGWGCCPKRVLTFEEFLEIPGCTVGQHSNVAQPKPTTQATTTPSASLLSANDNVETYGVRPTTTPVSEKKKVETEQDIYLDRSNENDADGAVIEVGTTCKRNGCNAKYAGEQSREEICSFHEGPPLFHEGSKGWQCCPKKTVWAFEDFFAIPGCRTGKHKFLPFKSDKLAENEVKCRYDWYQMGNFVNLCVYGKNVDKEKSKIQFEDFKVHVLLTFKDGKIFQKEFHLPRSIVPEKSKFEILSTKLEMKLFKAETIAWQANDF
eukprot:TRINITY_DN8847_c0_g1_i1.p1 TRINITY_DN8847_c0_g1~~TRINITY_DN8847_c0_g1_i1.p1  ORF type:complete len:388 (+),score=61.82 TRINITY_DN8847_c0_g1_i1:23-1186(+)